MQQQLAHYQIQNLLGQGTFASVYRAFDQKFERDVALKVLKPVWLSDPQAVERFKREAKTMARLRHPHIVDVYDVGEGGGYIYLAQLLVEGETLTARLKRGPLAWPEMLEVLRAMAAALDYAHGQEVVHLGEGYAEIHELLQAAASSVDQEERNELYARVNGLLVEYVPMVPIAHGSSAAAFKAGVTGAHAAPLMNEYFAVMALPGQDTLVWMQRTEPASAYCADEWAGDTFRLCQQVSESLLAYEVGSMEVKPGLAEGFEVNDDLTEWIFYLRPGVKFHDGSELDAQDVLLSYEAQWNAASPLHTGREGNFSFFNSFFGMRNQ